MPLKTAPQPPLKPPIDPQRDHVLGPAEARIELVEYGDYQCPHCRITQGIIRELSSRYGSDLRFAFRHFPLAKLHPQARLAAEASEAAAAQGKFWEMHNWLFEHPQELELDQLVEHARTVGLDADRVASELFSHSHANHVQDDVASAVRSGVNATPTFFLNGLRHNGGYQLEGLVEAIDRALAGT